MDEQNPVKILVLVADDDPDTRDILRIALSRKEYTVIEVADGREMVSRARQEKPSLIIADIMMPHIDGVEAAALLREEPYFRNMPVLFISCIVGGEPIVNRIREMPRCAFIAKPFDHGRFLATVEKLLQAPPHAA